MRKASTSAVSAAVKASISALSVLILFIIVL
jgi:hypothetical protein